MTKKQLQDHQYPKILEILEDRQWRSFGSIEDNLHTFCMGAPIGLRTRLKELVQAGRVEKATVKYADGQLCYINYRRKR
jgi:hypothetical protein